MFFIIWQFTRPKAKKKLTSEYSLQMSIVATKLQTSDTDQLRIVESLTFKSNLAFLAKDDALVDCIEGDKSSTCSVV